MTVDEAIEWLESAKRESERSGQDISNYPIEGFDPKVDHGLSVVRNLV